MERTLVASRAIWFYLGKLFWPLSLTFIYPQWTIRPTHFLDYGWLMGLAALGVMIYLLRRYVGRGVEVAAAFFVLTLSPVLGFIMLYTFRYTFVADHYQYLASIGPIALAAAGTATLAATWKGSRHLILGSALCVVGILAALTWHQTKIYCNLETLWRDTLAKNPAAWMAHNNLGSLLARQGKLTEAIEQYQQALQLKPDFSEVYNNLGNTLARQGKLAEAIQCYKHALELNPSYAESPWIAHNNLGNALTDQGKLPEAIQCYKRALELYPGYAEAYYNWGNVLAHQGKLSEAIQHYERAIQLQPGYAQACYNMGVALRDEGKVAEAIQQFERAIQLKPDYVEALNNLAYLLATSQNVLLRNTTKAIALSEQANHLTGGANPIVLETLATAYAGAGRYREAVETISRAIEQAAVQGNSALVSDFESQLRLYRALASGQVQ
jgi:tetratricopeptide (TPR) repeat protein